MTDRERAEQTKQHILASTISGVEWQKRVTYGYKGKPYNWRNTEIGKAMILLDEIGVIVPPPDPDPVPTGPIVITQGGTYTGNWKTTDGTAAVRIKTTEPVTIVNSTVTSTGTGGMFVTDWPLAVDLTIEKVKAFGASGRFLETEGHKSVTVRNCTIDKTSGLYLNAANSSSTVSITKNKLTNVQRGSNGGYRQFVQLNRVVSNSLDISWNEVINEFGKSEVEDVISIHMSANAHVHDNYIQGGFPAAVGDSYSGGGITIEEVGSHSNRILNNIVVGCINGGIGIAGGYNNLVQGNTVISDGRADGGPLFAAANVGLIVWNSNNDPQFGGNRSIYNKVGYVRFDGQRNNMWFPHAPQTDYALNTELPDPINDALEKEQWNVWVSKKQAAGITVGA